MSIYYLGPEASFTHEAALQLFTPKQLIPLKSIEDVLAAVKKHPHACAVVPVENSLEGIVMRALDFIREKNLTVVGEVSLPIEQNLLSKENTLKNIHTIYSHPYALAQAHAWIKKHLPKAHLKETTSTSSAAQKVQTEPHSAAIASRTACATYGLITLGKGIQNTKKNITRFWIVSAKKNACFRGHIPTKTSMYVLVEDKVGALSNLLGIFQENRINLTFIQSRNVADELWRYGFFIDILADVADPLVQKMIRQLKKTQKIVQVFGSYPQIGTNNKRALIRHTILRIESIFRDNAAPVELKRMLRQERTKLKQGNAPRDIMSILSARLMIMPSIALYKYRHHLTITDTRRERALLQKLKKYATLHTLYTQTFVHSKIIQKETTALLHAKALDARDIVPFTLKHLRYYIDYLDFFILEYYATRPSQKN